MLRTLLPHDYHPSKPYRILIDHFWPGPLTLLFPRHPDLVPDIVTAGHPTVAVRFPSHPIARALIAIANTPIAAPSANTSGKPSPTRAEHVSRDLGGKISLILDGGPSDVGLESTVVDGLSDPRVLRVIRPGGVTVEDIQTVLAREMAGDDDVPQVLVHKKDYQDTSIELAPTTPGMKYRHYSPSVPVILLLTHSPPPAAPSWDAFVSELATSLPSLRTIGILSCLDSPLAQIKGDQWTHYSLGHSSTPSFAAHRLFDGLIALEQKGVDLILVEEFKEEREGLAIMNRLRKAAGQTQWVSLSPPPVVGFIVDFPKRVF
jgi:L-threonylcarbamoyladenylate synthase